MVHSQTSAEKKRLERWERQNEEILDYAADRQLEFWADYDEEDEDEDVVPAELLNAVRELSRDEYDVEEIMNETYLDLDQIVHFLEETQKFEPKHDDKLNKLKRLLASKELQGQKVLVFSEFADTARYVSAELEEAGFDGVFQIDSGRGNRAEVIKRFSPYYNGSTSAQLSAAGQEEIRILISTDILSEGLNLQDATRLVNYDIRWNPVRLMQRIGRVDRRMNPQTEERLGADHPELKDSRGKVSFWNFLPPGELNEILSLYKTVTGKALLISKTLGIEGKKLLTPEDDYAALKEFNHVYEGTRTAMEDLHLAYQALLQADPGLEERLRTLPGSIFSGRKRTAKGSRGVFLCYRLPALDKATDLFTEEAGTTRWYLYDLDRDDIVEEPGEIVESIRSKPTTPRRRVMEESALIEIRDKVLKHIKNTYLKRIDAPMGVRRWRAGWSCTTHERPRERTNVPAAPEVPQGRAGLADRVKRLRGPHLRLHPGGTRDRQQECCQDPGNQAAPAAHGEPAVGHLLHQVRTQEATHRRAAQDPERLRPQEASVRQSSGACRLGRRGPPLHLHLRRGGCASDHLRALLAGSRQGGLAERQRARLEQPGHAVAHRRCGGNAHEAPGLASG